MVIYGSVFEVLRNGACKVVFLKLTIVRLIDQLVVVMVVSVSRGTKLCQLGPFRLARGNSNISIAPAMNVGKFNSDM